MDPHLNPPPPPPPPLFPHLTADAPPFTDDINQPPPTLPPIPNHPPYSQMIISALSALNEPDGSSKRAIAKYMESHFPGLPANNSDLLIHHIKMLKATGNIVMVKNSYKLCVPGSAPVAASSPPVLASNGVVSSDPAASGAVKRRGRPPKAKPEFTQAATAVPVFENTMSVNATPVFVPLDAGTVNGAVTSPVGTGRGRGRPPKNSGAKQGPGRPAKSGGRPKKVAVAGSPKGSGRPRGRPKRIVQVNEGVAPPVETTGLAAVGDNVGGALPEKVVTTEAVSLPVGSPKGSERGRGRPRKAVQVAPSVGGAGTTVEPPVGGGSAVARSVGRPKGSGRGRGRPKKLVAPPVGGEMTEVASPVVLGKRRGRPPRSASEAKKLKATPRKSSGRPAGRPRKNASSTTTQSPGSGSQLLMAYLDLKGKMDNLQSGIKQAAIVIRPCLNNIGALHALRELELLADGDTNQQPQQPTVEPPPIQQPLVQPPQQFAGETPITEPPPQPVMTQFQI